MLLDTGMAQLVAHDMGVLCGGAGMRSVWCGWIVCVGVCVLVWCKGYSGCLWVVEYGGRCVHV